MQFLKTLFWIALTVVLVLFAKGNWHAVTLRLWGGLEADVKLPILLLAMILLGFLPTFLLHRARLWGVRRRVEALERQRAAATAETAPPPASPADGEDRLATDSKVWPA